MIPKEEKCGSKKDFFLKEKKHIPKGEKYLSESSHEGEVARKREDQRGNHGFRGRPSHHWMVISIQATGNLEA